MPTTINHIITWEGRDIRLSYIPRTFRTIDYVGLETMNGEPIPMNMDGTYTLYFGPAEPILTINEVATMVVDWLDTEAQSAKWKAHLEASRQGSLF